LEARAAGGARGLRPVAPALMNPSCGATANRGARVRRRVRLEAHSAGIPLLASASEARISAAAAGKRCRRRRWRRAWSCQCPSECTSPENSNPPIHSEICLPVLSEGVYRVAHPSINFCIFSEICRLKSTMCLA
jgi:hypothetical protein